MMRAAEGRANGMRCRMSEVNPEALARRLRLRYPGTCGWCGTKLPARTLAAYDRASKAVTCLACLGNVGAIVEAPMPARAEAPEVHAADAAGTAAGEAEATEETADTEVELDTGVAGASARREQERRQARREQRIRSRHPRAGGLILAITDQPQSTVAWGVGATGEEMLGAGFDRLAERGVQMLHDRAIPGSKANIDHIAVTPSGVYVIDAKRYRRRRPHLQVDGGLFRPRTERLLVGTRDSTKLVAGMHKQLQVVTRALEYLAAGRPVPPITGVLCFVDADWPLIGGAFAVEGVLVEWPKKTYGRLTQTGSLDSVQVQTWHKNLAEAFPRA
jgi:nuclease-like protein